MRPNLVKVLQKDAGKARCVRGVDDSWRRVAGREHGLLEVPEMRLAVYGAHAGCIESCSGVEHFAAITALRKTCTQVPAAPLVRLSITNVNIEMETWVQGVFDDTR